MRTRQSKRHIKNLFEETKISSWKDRVEFGRDIERESGISYMKELGYSCFLSGACIDRANVLYQNNEFSEATIAALGGILFGLLSFRTYIKYKNQI